MKSAAVRRFLALSAVVMFLLVPGLARATVANTALSGWTWGEPSTAYMYVSNETNWIYIADAASTNDYWFYDFSTTNWTQAANGGAPQNWLWWTAPYLYDLDTGHWMYVQQPARGGWVYHFKTAQWTWMF